MLCRLCHSLRVTFVPFISFCSDHACVWLELCSRQSAILSFSIFNFSAFRRSLFGFFFIEFHNFCKLPTRIDNLPLDAFSIHPSALVLFVLYFCSHFYSLFNFFYFFHFLLDPMSAHRIACSNLILSPNKEINVDFLFEFRVNAFWMIFK